MEGLDGIDRGSQSRERAKVSTSHSVGDSRCGTLASFSGDFEKREIPGAYASLALIESSPSSNETK